MPEQYENKRELSFNKVAGYSPVKINGLNRLENMTLTVQYNFRGNITKTKTLYVPYSEFVFRKRIEKLEEKKNSVGTFLIPSAAGGVGLLIMLSLPLLSAAARRKRKLGSSTLKGRIILGCATLPEDLSGLL